MDKSKLSKVGKLIIEIFEEEYPDDNYYINSKIGRLEGLNDFEVLFWASGELDVDNKHLLAEKIGCDITTLQMTFLTIRQIRFL